MINQWMGLGLYPIFRQIHTITCTKQLTDDFPSLQSACVADVFAINFTSSMTRTYTLISDTCIIMYTYNLYNHKR